MERPKEFISVVNSKGQVTIPAVVRDKLGISTPGTIVFRIMDVSPLPVTLEEAYGAVTPTNRPEDYAKLRRTAREERVARFLIKADAQ